MRSTEVIVTVRQLELSLREQGITAIYLFGSGARETQTCARRDRALLPDRSIAHPMAIGGSAQRQVDLIERDYLRPRISERAERDMIRIF
jgi:predicted nucleotidyltransferase